MQFHRLIDRFPGSKARYLKIPGILPMAPVETTLEPFAGSGAFSLAMVQNGWAKRAFGGDKDRSLRAIYGAWLVRELHPWVYQEIECFQSELAANQDGAWSILKERFESGSPAASLCLRKLTYGGVVRYGNQSGKLNIKYSQSQLQPFLAWDYRFPPIADFKLSDDCFDAIAACRKANPESVAAWIDPPYYLPRADYGRMVPCYPGHQPHSVETLQLALDSLQQTAEIPQLEYLVYTNYSSVEHDQAVAEILSEFGFDSVRQINNGRLDSMHRNQGKASVFASEGIWIAQRTALSKVQQLSLFAA